MFSGQLTTPDRFSYHTGRYILYMQPSSITTSPRVHGLTDGSERERERQAEREREWVSGRWREGVGWHEEGNRWGIEGRVLLSNWRRRAEWEMLHFFVLLLMLQDASLFCSNVTSTLWACARAHMSWDERTQENLECTKFLPKMILPIFLTLITHTE